MPLSPREVAIWPNRLVFGAGAVQRLREIANDLNCQRALVVCGRTVAGGAMLAAVRAGLGDACVGVHDKVGAHTPLPDLRMLVAQAKSVAADIIVSVGGGSAIDAGKAASLLLATGDDLTPYAIRYSETGMQRKLLPGRAIAHLAVPTTSGSASEVMPTAGVRDPERRIKMLFWDDRLIPDAVILDPEMAVHCSPAQTAATGMTAVARCVETLYSRDRHPFSTALALHGLTLLKAALPRAVAMPDDLEARADCQYACAMSGVAAINAMVSLVHAVGHVVGGRYALQHGVSHAILLPSAIRLLMPDEALATDMERLLAALPLRARLRDLGIAAEDLAGIAADTQHDYMMANLPRALSDGEIEQFLHAAW